MHFRWSLATPQPFLASQLAAELKLPPLLVKCIFNRGVDSLEGITSFLEPRLKELSDPYLLPNMESAVSRLMQARQSDELVVVFGDYDVDGVTSTALLLEVLRALGWKAEFYLPHRMDEGYGLSREGIENCLARHRASLVLAVDCGSTATATIDWLKTRRVDVIVLDHHQISDPPPAAVALVNPKLEPSATEWVALCSVGLAFKLAHALVKRGRAMGDPVAAALDLRGWLDLVALGTIADMVPLQGENRTFVSVGLRRLNDTTRPGLLALRKVAQTPGPVGVYEVGFQLAPRLNAAGRLEDAQAALDLLLARDLDQAEPLALQLDARNRERQQIERKIVEEVTGAVRAKFDPETDYAIVEGGLLWHIGVVGIVASRVLREFYRPTVILGGEGTEWRGSGRSIDGFDLAAAFRDCGDLLIRHGGHALAAGLTIESGKVDLFRQRLNELARQRLTPELLTPVLRVDAEVHLGDLSVECVDALQRLEPVGQGNPAVQLVARNLSHARPPQAIGREQQHLKLWLTDGTGTCEAVWWNHGGRTRPENGIDLAFTPKINEFNGRRLVQLKVLDWQASGCGDQRRAEGL